MSLVISHWLYPVQVLGPGNRLGLWLQGCSRKCKGCIAPELQGNAGTEYDLNTLADTINQLIKDNKLDGITISGGEPFEQKDELLKLCSLLVADDILVYTGYSYEELKELCQSDLTASKISVIITNPYIEERNDDLPLRGSSNQEIIYLNPLYKNMYEQYLLSAVREQQFFVEENTIYHAGIPLKGQAEMIRREINNIIEGGKKE